MNKLPPGLGIMTVAVVVVFVLLLLAACQTTGGSFCAISKPIRLSAATVERLSDAEVERILIHNETGQKLCGWRP